MHECPACGEACDCDGEHDQSAPDICTHDCDDIDSDEAIYYEPED